jgi:hypothetical protein
MSARDHPELILARKLLGTGLTAHSHPDPPAIACTPVYPRGLKRLKRHLPLSDPLELYPALNPVRGDEL